jgi:hypothetical protein
MSEPMHTEQRRTEREKPSTLLPPAKTIGPYVFRDGARGVEYDIGPYQVCVRWDWLGAEQKSGSYAMLQVCRADGGSVMDWRDLQQIKNSVCGDEWEAVEIFPAERRLKDPSNARYLWASSGGFPFGLPGGRLVLDAHESIAPQRPFPTRATSSEIDSLRTALAAKTREAETLKSALHDLPTLAGIPSQEFYLNYDKDGYPECVMQQGERRCPLTVRFDPGTSPIEWLQSVCKILSLFNNARRIAALQSHPTPSTGEQP